MSFSNNNSRSYLKRDAYGTNITLSNQETIAGDLVVKGDVRMTGTTKTTFMNSLNAGSTSVSDLAASGTVSLATDTGKIVTIGGDVSAGKVSLTGDLTCSGDVNFNGPTKKTTLGGDLSVYGQLKCVDTAKVTTLSGPLEVSGSVTTGGNTYINGAANTMSIQGSLQVSTDAGIGGTLSLGKPIKLPTGLAAAPAAGELGYTISGTFNPDSKLTARISPYSGYLSGIKLPVGVWLIQATAGVKCEVNGNNLNTFSIQISTSKNGGADLLAGSASALDAGTYSCLALNTCNLGSWNSVDNATCVDVLTSTTYYLNFYLQFTGGATAYTVNTTSGNPFSFKATRIA